MSQLNLPNLKLAITVKWQVLHLAIIERQTLHSQQPPDYSNNCKATTMKWRLLQNLVTTAKCNGHEVTSQKLRESPPESHEILRRLVALVVSSPFRKSLKGENNRGPCKLQTFLDTRPLKEWRTSAWAFGWYSETFGKRARECLPMILWWEAIRTLWPFKESRTGFDLLLLSYSLYKSGPEKRGHYERGLFTGGISRISTIL